MQVFTPVKAEPIDIAQVKAILFVDYWKHLADNKEPLNRWGIFILNKDDMGHLIGRTHSRSSAQHWAQFFGTVAFCKVIDDVGNEYEHLELR